MTIHLSQPDFQRLVQIVQNLPEFGAVRDRRRLLSLALTGVDRANSILGGIDVDGSPMLAAIEVVRFLADFGQVSEDREALSVFLDLLLANMGGGEEADFLSDLIDRYAMNPRTRPITPPTIYSEPASGASSQYIFVSYARPDRNVAEIVYQFLISAGFRVFLDIKSIKSGDNWDIVIEQALKEATHMVLLLSASSMPYRKEVYREWFYFDQNKKAIHPLYLQDCVLHSRLIAYNYLDAKHDLQGSLDKLVLDIFP